nr:MAG TPA: hypothetical protein [Caudoviricetes sp.]
MVICTFSYFSFLQHCIPSLTIGKFYKIHFPIHLPNFNPLRFMHLLLLFIFFLYIIREEK